METNQITEKVYCYDHPSAYNNCNEAALLAAMCNKQHTDPALTAMMANGGMNGMWNNPFVYLVWMMFAGRFFNNGNGWGDCNGGQAAQNIELQNQLAAIRSQLSDNQNSTLLMDAIKGNNVAIGQLASNLNCDFNALQNAICCVKSAIEQVGGQVGFSAERVINAVNMGDCNVIQAIKDCCCQTQQLVQRMGYENQLAQKDNIAAMQKGFCDLGFGMQSGFDRINTGLERGFSQVGYETQKQTCDIINAGKDNTQRIIDVLNNHWQADLQQRYNDARLELSQKTQNEYLINQLKKTCCQ